MKKLLLFFVLSILFTPVFAQLAPCSPDPAYQDSTGVYPLPYDSIQSPDGGIPDSACLNVTYKFTFTAAVGDTIDLDGNILTLDSLILETVTGLPDGIDWACDPPNCVFKANTLGCVGLYGTVTDDSFLGDNDLLISATVYSPFFEFPLTFPNPALFPGSYSLYVHPEDYPNCTDATSAREVPAAVASVNNLPNPFSGYTTIEIMANERASLEFAVYNLLGEVVETRRVDVFEGKNALEFDGSQLPDGIYLYSFSDGRNVITKKMVISR